MEIVKLSPLKIRSYTGTHSNSHFHRSYLAVDTARVIISVLPVLAGLVLIEHCILQAIRFTVWNSDFSHTCYLYAIMGDMRHDDGILKKM